MCDTSASAISPAILHPTMIKNSSAFHEERRIALTLVVLVGLRLKQRQPPSVVIERGLVVVPDGRAVSSKPLR
jgi:hypothetical protein